jgi:hypothetical protein
MKTHSHTHEYTLTVDFTGSSLFACGTCKPADSSAAEDDTGAMGGRRCGNGDADGVGWKDVGGLMFRMAAGRGMSRKEGTLCSGTMGMAFRRPDLRLKF